MIQQKNSLNPTIQKSSLSLSTFIRQMLRGWPWFLVAFILFVLISLRISSNLQLGVAEYKMTIMSRYKDLSKEIRTNNGDKDYIWDKEPPYSVEQLYGFLLSSDIIYKAGKRVGFDVDYSQRSKLRTYDVYNNLPFQLFFLDAYDNDTFTLTAHWGKEGVHLSQLNGTFRGAPISAYFSFSSTIALGDTIDSPIGRIVCKEQPVSEKYPPTSLNLSRPIIVKKIDTNRALTLFDKDMDLKRYEEKSLTVFMSVAGSARRVIEVMEAMIEICDEQVKSELMEDLEEQSRFLKESLRHIDTLALPSEAKNKERAMIAESLVRNETNRSALDLKKVITVTDPPVARPASSATGYFRIILFVLLMTVALLGVYYTRIMKKSLFSREQMPLILQRKLFGPFHYKPKQSESAFEKSVLSLDPLRIAYEGATSLFVSSCDKPREMLWLTSLLATNISRSGRRVVRLHYHTEGKNPPKGCQSIVVKSGYIGGDAFWKDLSTLRESFGTGSLIVISADCDLQRQLLPFFSDILFVVVREKSSTRWINEFATLVEDRMHKDAECHIATAWVDLSLFTSTRK